MIYLDNSSTTHRKPRCVIKACKKGLTSLSVNSSRAGYNLAIKGSIEILKIRTAFAQEYNTQPENVVFTGSCTMALNLALRGCAKPNGHIVATILEHNSVLRTLEYLKQEYNISYTLVKPVMNTIRPEDIEKAITKNTYMVCCIHTSNVTGATNPIDKIGSVCKKHNLLYLVDCAQSGGHIKINMQDCNINLLALAGHKGYYAPQGVGVLISNRVTPKPIVFGGTGTYSEKLEQPTESPEGLESGTPSMPCILGLGKGLEYVNKHFNKLNNKVFKLTRQLLFELKNNKNINLYSFNANSGIVSFNIKGKTSSEVSDLLSERYNICTRSGLHCAPKLHEYYNTLSRGMVRISISPFNKKWEIKKCIKAINEITKL